jgi:hypothetical protein
MFISIPETAKSIQQIVKKDAESIQRIDQLSVTLIWQPGEARQPSAANESN